MLTRIDFYTLLNRRKTLVIDGALATELETRGHDLNHQLWSGRTLQEDPESIQKVHLDYYLAGADIAITASYQTSTDGLQKYLHVSNDEAISLIQRSVHLAQRARDQAYKQGRDAKTCKLLVAGSVGPYGAFLHDGSEYRGDYSMTTEHYRDFHYPRVKALVDAGVDMLAIETIPSMPEIEAILLMLAKDFPTTIAWLSITLRDSEHLSDGTPIKSVITATAESKQIIAAGVNCIPLRMVTASLQHMKSVLEDLPAAQQMPLLCYPNSGETFHSETNSWEGSGLGSDDELATRVAYWRDAGARLIGGCCRTGPGHVGGIAKTLKEQHAQEQEEEG
ncbi:hypothetical protein LTR62_000461 [Meristemomyces frigidus]|uniref:Hcy-binding domain-containing protein n=1 Tax=Meristemomyces frigidus TaxID=1508187 RepID=A0AAN7TPF3_9PEZI|nr:hypothetical protein LTR62_000461 [Meristemomyces frigidus]